MEKDGAVDVAITTEKVKKKTVNFDVGQRRHPKNSAPKTSDEIVLLVPHVQPQNYSTVKLTNPSALTSIKETELLEPQDDSLDSFSSVLGSALVQEIMTNVLVNEEEQERLNNEHLSKI